MPKISFKFHILAFGAHGDGISGGDRIFIELAKRWSQDFSVTIYGWEEGVAMCRRQNLVSEVNWVVSQIKWSRRGGFGLVYLMMILAGIGRALWLGLTNGLENKSTTVVYCASEFWMDSLPALILKWRFRHITWIAAWYQTAPKPWQGFSEGKRAQSYWLNGLVYWLMQWPIKPLIQRWADGVMVNNELEKQVYPELDRQGKVMVLIGAVNLEPIEQWQKQHSIKSTKYLGVFQGRFHPQKGVIELIEIWSKVVQRLPQAKLVMIGDGPLMGAVKRRIKELDLAKSVELVGYVYDGDQKYQIFSQSQLVLHPSFFDSGGMATAEAMVFGIPAIGFDLKAYQSYYPQGMIKVPIGDLQAFSEAVVKLAANNQTRHKLGMVAAKMVKSHYSWDRRADEVLSWIRRQAEAKGFDQMSSAGTDG